MLCIYMCALLVIRSQQLVFFFFQQVGVSAGSEIMEWSMDSNCNSLLEFRITSKGNQSWQSECDENVKKNSH